MKWAGGARTKMIPTKKRRETRESVKGRGIARLKDWTGITFIEGRPITPKDRSECEVQSTDDRNGIFARWRGNIEPPLALGLRDTLA